MHVCKNDLVAVMAGNEAGKTGKIMKVLRDKKRVIIKGLNLMMKPEINVGIAANIRISGATDSILSQTIINNTIAAKRNAIHVHTYNLVAYVNTLSFRPFVKP